MLSVHGQPPVIRHRIVIIAEVDRPIATSNCPLDLGVVRGDHLAIGSELRADAINKLIDERLQAKAWQAQSAIFGDKKFKKMGWALDFAKLNGDKGTYSVEVVFNNAGSLGWNLIKLVLACERNHVEKAIETEIGIIVLATKDMESAGGFDGNAIATFENAQLSLKAMQTILTSTPIIIVGLEPMKTFKIEQYSHTYPDGRKKMIGKVVRL